MSDCRHPSTISVTQCGHCGHVFSTAPTRESGEGVGEKRIAEIRKTVAWEEGAPPWLGMGDIELLLYALDNKGRELERSERLKTEALIERDRFHDQWFAEAERAQEAAEYYDGLRDLERIRADKVERELKEAEAKLAAWVDFAREIGKHADCPYSLLPDWNQHLLAHITALRNGRFDEIANGAQRLHAMRDGYERKIGVILQQRDAVRGERDAFAEQTAPRQRTANEQEQRAIAAQAEVDRLRDRMNGLAHLWSQNYLPHMNAAGRELAAALIGMGYPTYVPEKKGGEG